MINSVNNDIVSNLIICSRFLRNLRHTNLTQDKIIILLKENGSMMSQKDIKNALGIRAASISELIYKLNNRGLIRKEQSEEDKRAFNIYLTDLGEDRYKSIVASDYDYENLFSSLSDDELETLNKTLEKLSTNWSNIEPSAVQDHGHKHSS